MNRHSSLLLLALLIVLPAALVACDDGNGTAEPRNLVLISLDTLRADRLGCYGYLRETSPNLDAFAAESVLFEYAVSQANETVRSHRSLFTSVYPTESLILRDRQVMADYLRASGFATGGFTGGGPLSKDFGFHQGFDSYQDWGKGLKLKCRQALQWLDTLPGDQPFFLFLHCFDIHAPYAPPPPYDQAFGAGNPSRIEPRQTADICRRIRNLRLGTPGDGRRLSDNDRQRLSDLYDGGIRYVDVLLNGFFLDLEDRGLLENSVIVVLADHGEEFWDHGSVLHGHTLHQELTHVPLIIRAPGLPPRRVPGQVGLIDVLPTVFQLLGVPVPGDAVGLSLLPLMRGEKTGRDGGPLISEGMEKGHYAVIDDGYKLIRRPDLKRYQLFDLATDITERNDIAGQERERLTRMRKVMELHHKALLKLPPAAPLRTPRRGEGLDRQTEDRLRELGYLEPENATAASGNDPSVK